jgi:hypothetical protein
MFVTAGCSTAEATGASDEAVTATTHPVRVRACDATHDHDADQAGSTLAMIRAESSWQDCLVSADDAAVATIESNLAQAGSELVGKTRPAIDAARKAGEALCLEEDKASSNFGGSLARVEAASCRASREHLLAQLMDAFVDFGGKPAEIPEARADHARCYAAYDPAIAAAVSTADMLQAVFGLVDCVNGEAGALAEPVAKIEVDNDPSVGDLTTSTARVTSVSHDATLPDGGLCTLLNQAGENGIGSLSRVTAATCQARVAESVYADLKTVAAP